MTKTSNMIVLAGRIENKYGFGTFRDLEINFITELKNKAKMSNVDGHDFFIKLAPDELERLIRLAEMGLKDISEEQLPKIDFPKQ